MFRLVDFDLFGPDGSMTMGRAAIHTSVEDCLRLDTSAKAIRSQLLPGEYRRGTWTWSRDGERVASIGYAMNGLGDQIALELDYKVSGRPTKQLLTLVRTRPNFGGERWWFLCPLELAQGHERRVRCLFMPPGKSLFAGRQAHSLNYESQKRSKLTRTISRLLRDCA